jgi:hypothetical protein
MKYVTELAIILYIANLFVSILYFYYYGMTHLGYLIITIMGLVFLFILYFKEITQEYYSKRIKRNLLNLLLIINSAENLF